MLSLWKSGADTARPKTANRSIRGTISGPIPIADDEFPMRQPGTGIATTTKDDEFPIRQRGTGIASPVPPDHLEPEPPQAPLAETLPEPVVPSAQVMATDDSDETPPPQPEPVLAIPVTAAQPSDSPSIAGPGLPTTPQPSTSPQQPRNSPLKTSPPRTSSFSRPSTFPARQTGLPVSTITRDSFVSPESTGVSAGQPRKKSALRSAIGRLFGRNKKKNRASQNGSSARSSATVRPSQHLHHSDPTLLIRTEQPSAPVPRTASLPVTEYDRPLRSHSIGAEDMMAIESARNSLQGPSPQADLMATPRPRAATLSRPSFHRGEWSGGLAPRPASSRGVMEVDDPNEIGRAITSDSGQGLHRRSRSESGMEDMARAGTRRRSVEIRYWRESYDPAFLSPWSSNAHDDVDRDADGQADSSAPASPTVEQPPVPQTPPEPFNFGSLTNQMIGMKITQAASIGSRIETLEARSQSLERVVSQLSRAVPGFKGPWVQPPTGPSQSIAGKPLRRQSVDTDTSQMSFSGADAVIGSLLAPSSSVAAAPAQTPNSLVMGPPPADRSLSNSTVRGLTTGGDAAEETQRTLMQQLDAERAARRALEAQVRKLADRLNALSATMYAMAGGPSKSRSQELFAPPSPNLGRPSKSALSSRLSPPSAVPTPAYAPDGPTPKLHADGAEDVDEDDMGDSFQTPREEVTPHPYGAFGEDLRANEVGDDDGSDDDDDDMDDDPKRKKAARTLSLSQLTVGKGVAQI